MILPAKHIKLSESLFGLGGFLLNLIKKPITVDELWILFSEFNNTPTYPSYHSFDNFILCIDYLYMIGIIKVDQEGRLSK